MVHRPSPQPLSLKPTTPHIYFTEGSLVGNCRHSQAQVFLYSMLWSRPQDDSLSRIGRFFARGARVTGECVTSRVVVQWGPGGRAWSVT